MSLCLSSHNCSVMSCPPPQAQKNQSDSITFICPSGLIESRLWYSRAQHKNRLITWAASQTVMRAHSHPPIVGRDFPVCIVACADRCERPCGGTVKPFACSPQPALLTSSTHTGGHFGYAVMCVCAHIALALYTVAS